MLIRTPSYVTRNRLGIFLFQIRIPHSKKLFQKSLSTRDKRTALQLARRWMVMMEDNEFDVKKVKDRLNIGGIFNVGIGTSTSPAPAPAQAPERKYSDKEDPTLDFLVDKWIDAEVRHKSKSTQKEFPRNAELFLQIVKELNGNVMPRVSELTVQHVRDYRETFEKIPKSVRAKGKTIKQLTGEKGERKSPVTIRNEFQNVGVFIAWIASNQYPIDPRIHGALTHFRKIKGTEKKRRVPFDCDDLKRMFESEMYQRGQCKRASDFWVPLIALHTGMTRNEIVQLEKDDIRKVDGATVIDINADGDKQLKVDGDPEDQGSTGRPRVVPVHPQLVKLGFLKFVDDAREPRLFPDEVRNNRGHFGAYGNRFRNYRNKVGAGPRHDKELRDFHSFRHTMKTKLREVEKDDGVIDDILGHTSTLRSTVGRTYDHSDRVRFKDKALKKVKFGCIDFDLIKPWQHHKFAN